MKPSSTARSALAAGAAVLLLGAVTAPSADAAAQVGAHHAAPPKATKLAVKAPKTAGTGATIHVTVTAETKAGKRAKSYRGKVRLTDSAAKATLPKTYHFTKKDAGRHTFTHVVLRTIGKQTITAADTKSKKIKGHVAITVAKLTNRTTATALSCSPVAAVVATPTACTATVTDTDIGAAIRPAGTVSFTSDGGAAGGAFAATSCTLPKTGTDRCAVSYTPSTIGSGTDHLTAKYASTSSTHLASTSASAALPVCATQSTWTVEQTGGSDASCQGPFATIARALGVATSGDTVQVDAGTYSAGTGDKFPLVVPAGVMLHGDSGTNTPTIQGNLTFSGAEAQMSRVAVQGNIAVTAAGVNLNDSDVTGGAHCVSVSSQGVDLNGLLIENCDAGVVLTGTASVSMFSNELASSAYNLEVSGSATADLSAGQNILTCATLADLYTTSTATIDAANVAWDHATPTTASTDGPADGVDIYAPVGSGAVTTTGSSLESASTPCP